MYMLYMLTSGLFQHLFFLSTPQFIRNSDLSGHIPFCRNAKKTEQSASFFLKVTWEKNVRPTVIAMVRLDLAVYSW